MQFSLNTSEFLLTSESPHYTSQRALSTHLRGLSCTLQKPNLFSYVIPLSPTKKSTEKPYKSPLHLSEGPPYIHQKDFPTQREPVLTPQRTFPTYHKLIPLHI